LNEVLNLDPFHDMDCKNQSVQVRKSENREHLGSREVQIPQRVSTEIVVRIPDGTGLCSIVTEKSRQMLDNKENDTVWAVFNAYAVVNHAD
jgi:molybdate transport system regulatory protein